MKHRLLSCRTLNLTHSLTLWLFLCNRKYEYEIIPHCVYVLYMFSLFVMYQNTQVTDSQLQDFLFIDKVAFLYKPAFSHSCFIQTSKFLYICIFHRLKLLIVYTFFDTL